MQRAACEKVLEPIRTVCSFLRALKEREREREPKLSRPGKASRNKASESTK
jgi:hypothetical protein